MPNRRVEVDLAVHGHKVQLSLAPVCPNLCGSATVPEGRAKERTVTGNRLRGRWCIALSVLVLGVGCSRTPETEVGTAPAAPATSAESSAAAMPAPQPAASPASPLDAARKGPLLQVTAENFTRAETDLFFGISALKDGAFGKFLHRRNVMGVDDQFVVRGNRDTLYSVAVFDLDAGPVTITMPDPGARFQALQIIDQDQYVPNVFYGKGSHTLTREDIGTRYVGAAVRTLVDPTNEDDVKQATALQDAIVVKQGQVGSFEMPNWDPASQKKIRDALLALAESLPDTRRAFGPRGKVDPVRFLIASASAWGGNPDKDALYLNFTPAKNDGSTVYHLSVGQVPVDGFWSISVYNAEGYYARNDYNAYTLNNLTAKKGADGSIDVQFGGCDGKIANCLPITPGWNYMVRLYRSRPEILSGEWKFPEAQAVP